MIAVVVSQDHVADRLRSHRFHLRHDVLVHALVLRIDKDRALTVTMTVTLPPFCPISPTVWLTFWIIQFIGDFNELGQRRRRLRRGLLGLKHHAKAV